MQTTKKRQNGLLIIELLVLALFLTACSSTSPTPATNASTNSTALALPTTATKSATSVFSSITTVVTTSPPLPTATLNLFSATPFPIGYPTMPVDYSSRWLKGVPCGVPCWEGITPGVTPLEDAIQLLKQNSLVRTISIFTKTLNGESYVLWDWINANPGGQAYYDPKSSNKVINSIRPNYATELLTLSDVIEAFGEPEYIIATYSRGAETTAHFYDLYFSYVTKGFSLEASTNGRTYTPSLNPGMYVEQPSFFVPTKNLAQIKAKGAIAWQGFKDFSFYCRDPDHPDQLCTEPKK